MGLGLGEKRATECKVRTVKEEEDRWGRNTSVGMHPSVRRSKPTLNEARV